jgi:hypothetical protein
MPPICNTRAANPRFAANKDVKGTSTTESLPEQQKLLDFFCWRGNDFLATVETTGTNVVPHMGLTGLRIAGNSRTAQLVMRATHPSSGSGSLAFLNCHGKTPTKIL